MKKTVYSLLLAFAMIVSLCLPAFASNIPEGLSDEEKLEYIMQGTGYYLGNGGVVSEFADLLPQTRWSSGTGATHQYIASYGFDILRNEKSAAYSWYVTQSSAALSMIVQNTDWPDENETDSGFFSNHFYLQDSEQFNTSALDRFTSHYNAARNYFNSGNKADAFRELGRAIHYLEDASTPVHVSLDFYGVIGHAVFESYVNNHLSSYTATSGGQYNSMGVGNSYADIFETVSSYAYNYLPESIAAADSHASAQMTVPRAMRNVAGILFRFYNEVN